MKRQPREWEKIFANHVSVKAAVPNLFGTRGWFHGRQFFHRPGAERGQGGGSGGSVSDGERQMKLHSLAHRSPPAVWPGS